MGGSGLKTQALNCCTSRSPPTQHGTAGDLVRTERNSLLRDVSPQNGMDGGTEPNDRFTP